jgi:uncharacterized protein
MKVAKALIGALGLCALIAPSWAQNQMVMATGPIGGAWYPIGTAFVSILEAKAGIAFTQQPGGGVSNVLNVGSGKSQLAFTTSSVAGSAIHGTDDFAKRPQNKLRLIAALYPQELAIVVFADSPIHSVQDIKGQVLQTTARGTSTELLVRRVIEANGLTYKDFKSVNYSNLTDGANQMKDGQIDAMAQLLANPASFALDLESSKPIRLIPVSDEVATKVVDAHPGYVKTVIKGGTYASVKADTPTVGEPVLLVAGADLDEALVYKITKVLFENRNGIAQVHSVMRNFTPAFAVASPVIPIHPGALRYYKEIHAVQ